MIKAILLDIEGTLAPLSFVKEVLFPYSKERLPQFLRENWEREEVKRIINEATKIAGHPLDPESASELFSRWIDEDKKYTPLKELQGHIWQEGYEKGELKAPVYEDAYKKLLEWKERGIPLYVYSSGSVKAQKLFFSHTQFGDITHLFSGFFDTRIGSKKDKRSYEEIAKKLGLKPEEILFISDNPDELRSAKEAGMKVIQSVREGVSPAEGFDKIKSFEEIEL
ncbi:MAG: acireductone synthase [Aquificae bacterium]|nr:acireductone synthase [Aquificota bacterium]